MPSMMAMESELIDEAWAALIDGSPDAVDIDRPELTGETSALSSRYTAAETATACISTALMAAAALEQRGERERVRSTLDRGHAAAAVRSERFFTVGEGSTGMGFAPLSQFWRADDGWVRTHANYPWHRTALLETLGVGDAVATVPAAIADRSAFELEESVFAAGGIAAAVRTLEQWRTHPQG